MSIESRLNSKPSRRVVVNQSASEGLKVLADYVCWLPSQERKRIEFASSQGKKELPKIILN